MKHQQPSPKYVLGMDLGGKDGDYGVCTWYGADGEIELRASHEEVGIVAEFFGYTVDQFQAQRAKIQCGMIRDHRRQMDEADYSGLVAAKPGQRRKVNRYPACGKTSEGPTFQSVIYATAAILAVVLAAVYFFN
jgi:hypothetical protein